MNRKTYMNVDVHSIFQNIQKKIVSLSLCALIVASLSYMIIDFLVPKKYASTVLFSITSENPTMMTDRYRMRTALERMNLYFTSNTMQTALCELLGQEELDGKLEVEGLVNSNFVEVTCICDTPEKAFHLSSTLRKNASTILDPMTEMYKLKALGNDDYKAVYIRSKNPAIVAILLALIVWFLGIFYCVMEQILSGRVQSVEQAEKELDLKFLGAIPHEEHKDKQNMLIHSNLRSLNFVESFQRSALSFMRAMNKDNLKICTVTSYLENEGKSTVIANLALTLVKNKKRVLLIDADFRKPALHKVFEMEEAPNLAEFILGDKPAKEVVVRMPQKGLYCCFTQPVEKKVYDLFDNENLGIFIERLKNQVDYILIDTPPVAITDDAKAIAKLSDAMLMVVRTNMARIHDVNDKVEEFEKEGISVLGMLVNDHYEVVQQKGMYKYGNVYEQ